MKTCLPTKDDRGEEARLSSHFGSAPYWTVYDSDTGEVAVHPNANAGHQHGQCRPVGQLQALGVERLVCRGVGRRALEMLQQHGVTVYAAQGATVREAIADLAAERLSAVDPAQACQGHGPHAGLVHGTELGADAGPTG